MFILKKNSIILLLKKNVIEIPLTLSSKKKLNEKINGFRLAQKNSFWRELVVDFKVNNNFLITERGKICKRIEDLEFNIEELLKNINIEHNYELVSLQEIIDFKHLSSLDLSLSDNCRDKIHSKVNEIILPMTSAHGDLHVGNIIVTPQGSQRLIDWEHYEERSSYLFDILHLYTREICNKYKCSWTIAIQFNNLYDYEFLLSEIKKYHLKLDDLKIGYILNRTSLESKKKIKYLGYLPEKHVNKYKNVLKYLEDLIK